MKFKKTLLAAIIASMGTGGGSIRPSVSSVSSTAGAEGSSIVHTVTLAGAVTGASAVYTFSLALGSASVGDLSTTPTLSNGVTLGAGNVTVPPGVSSFTATVATTQDALFEGAETYSITVEGLTGTGTINNDESAPVVTSVSSAAVTEGSAVVHTVAISGIAQASRVYAIALTDGTAVTADYTALLSNGMFSGGVTVSGGNITVPAGVTSFTVTVATTDDAIVETGETYTLTVGGASGTGTILDNDSAPPAVDLSVNSYVEDGYADDYFA